MMQNVIIRETQGFFRDDFKPIHDGRKLTNTNFPKLIYGELVKRFVPEGQNEFEIIQMDSGIPYYRYCSYDPKSPYGWNYLHHYFRFHPTAKPVLDHKQIETLNYLGSKHLLQIKVLKSNYMFKDLSTEIKDFKGRYLDLLREFKVDVSTFEKELS